jgi:uncharacterized protein (TIGR03435 family)
MRRRHGFPGAFVILALTCATAGAQPPRLVFDAASVKPNTSGSGLVRLSIPPGRLSGVNVTLRMLLRSAYGLPDFRMSGGPGWMDADRFDVEATAGGSATLDQIHAMTKSLLEDRFKLKSHIDTREQPIYVLVPARRDGKLGDKIHQSGDECLPMMPLAGAPPAPPPPAGPAVGGVRQCPSMLALGGISGRQLPIARLVGTLSQYIGREIVDKTNLAGTFDFDLQWTPDQIPGGGRGLIPVAPFDPNGPSLFTALQEQLGLRLDSSRGPVDVLVIDGVEKPSSD